LWLLVDVAFYSYLHSLLNTNVRQSAKEDPMNKNKIIILYLLMLLTHVAHVFEETWGHFWIMDAIYGLGWFLVANWVLLCIPVIVFYFVLQEKPWAYRLSIVYAGIMILNGLGHNIATLVTGRYFGGFAGGCTGIGMIVIGSTMIYYLLKEIQTKEIL
jgi:hypothetical protein